MPTTKPRHMITESDDVAAALELAKARWPELSNDKGKLLKKMLEFSALAIAREMDLKRNSRLSKIEDIAGSMPDVWPENWREEARSEWPA